MDYVACAGQIHMAEIGYAPLPPQLSQFLANAVGYMMGQPAQQLSASNCSNPTFSGSLGAGASPPPLPPIGKAPGAPAPGAVGAARRRFGARRHGRLGGRCQRYRFDRERVRNGNRHRQRYVQIDGGRFVERASRQSSRSGQHRVADEPVGAAPLLPDHSRHPCRHLVHQPKARTHMTRSFRARRQSMSTRRKGAARSGHAALEHMSQLPKPPHEGANVKYKGSIVRRGILAGAIVLAGGERGRHWPPHPQGRATRR